MSYYLALPFIFALLAPGARAGIFDDERCFDDDGDRIDCPHEKDFEIRRILWYAIPLGLLFLLFVGVSIHYCVKSRRNKRAFANLDAPGGGPIPAYNVAAPQMEQGYAGHWVPPSQQAPPPQVPNPFQGGQPYGAPPGPPPNLAHGHSYDTDAEKPNDSYSSFHEVKINA